MEITAYGVTFQSTLNNPVFEEGVGFAFSSDTDIVINLGRIGVTGSIVLSGGIEDVDKWVVGFVQNVTQEGVNAYYGNNNVPSIKVTRRFIDYVTCPVLDSYDSATIWQVKPSEGSYAKNLPGTNPQPGEKMVTVIPTPLQDQPDAEFEWYFEEEELPLLSTAGTTSFQYWLAAQNVEDTSQIVILDPAGWKIYWSTQVVNLENPPAERAQRLPHSGASAIPAQAIEPTLTPPIANDPGIIELKVKALV